MFERLKLERKRLKLTQAAAAELAGIKRETWSRYESGTISPGMEVLAALAMAGGNINFVLTGVESCGVTLSKDEIELVSLYRHAPIAVKAAAIAALTAGTSSAKANQIVHGNVMGNVIEGGATFNAPMNFDSGSKKKR